MTGRWSPGIGDPSIVGWLTVVAYGVAAFLCAAVAWQANNRRRRDDDDPTVLFWGIVALMMFALGINKQLDLQSLFTQVMRDMVQAAHWYDRRRELQATFIFAIIAVAPIVGVAALRMMPMLHRNMKVALIGLIFVYTYVIVRAASFHHVDRFIGSSILGLKWNWLLELGGIIAIAYAAMREWHAGSR